MDDQHPDHVGHGWFVSRPALRYRLCDVCDRHVATLEMWQEPCPTAADGILYGHERCVRHNDGADDGD